MKIKFWGVRGSTGAGIRGTAIREKIKRVLRHAAPADILDEEAVERFLKSLPFSLVQTYGGNTTCIEVRTRSDDLIILDAGTGIRDLGNEMMKGPYAKGLGECHICFTHTHWDHIQGLPFFVPFYIPGNMFHIHAVSDRIEERLRYQHNPEHFPVTYEGMQSSRTYTQHEADDEWNLHGLRIRHKAMRHPGGSYSYRFEEDGRVFIFGSDAEFNMDDMEHIEDFLEYFRGADVLVFDTQYTFEEQLQKIDWGHSSASYATDIAMKSGVKNLVLFHHDPSYDDEKLDEVFLRALRYKEMMDTNADSPLRITMAYEGLEMEV